jgi:hypothetical protein
VSERGEIKRMGAKAQKNSGRGQHQKGDAVLGDFVVDIKEYSKSFSINQDFWAKICTDAMKVDIDKNPALQLVIGDEQKVRLAVIEWGVFEEMREAYEAWKASLS